MTMNFTDVIKQGYFNRIKSIITDQKGYHSLRLHRVIAYDSIGSLLPFDAVVVAALEGTSGYGGSNEAWHGLESFVNLIRSMVLPA